MPLSTVSTFTPIWLRGTAVKLPNYARWTRLRSTTHLFSVSFESRLSSNFWELKSSDFHREYDSIFSLQILESWAHSILSDMKLQKTICPKNIISRNGRRLISFQFLRQLRRKHLESPVFYFPSQKYQGNHRLHPRK